MKFSERKSKHIKQTNKNKKEKKRAYNIGWRAE